MSDISTDLEDAINAVPPWNPEANSYSFREIPKTDILRTTAQCMVVRFRELREDWYKTNRENYELKAKLEKAEAELVRKTDELERLRNALTPSDETKSAYMGEVSYKVGHIDEFGDEIQWEHFVPWTAIKSVMKLILEKSQQQGGE